MISRRINATPDGFEDLAEAREETLRVRFRGQDLGLHKVRIRPGSVELLDPAALVALLPELISPRSVVRALSGPLPSHAARACGPEPVAECDTLSPEIAGVIHDTEHGQLSLHLAADQIVERPLDSLARLPAARPDPALLLSLSAFASGQDRQTDFWTTDAQMTLGWGDTHLQIDGQVGKSGQDLRTGVLHHRLNGRIASLGLFEATPTALLAPKRLLGLRLADTLQDLAYQDKAFDTPVRVYLNRPARIDVFAGSVLLSSQRYGAGEITLDTGRFPGGTYDLELLIDDGLSQTRQTQVFSRQARIPPAGAAQSFIELGVSRGSYFNPIDDPNANRFEFRAGQTRRLSRVTAITVAVIAQKQDQFLEGSLRWQGRKSDLYLAAGISARGERAASLSARQSLSRWVFSGQVSHVHGQDTAPDYARTTAQYSHFLRTRENYWQASASLARSLKNGRLSLSGYGRRGEQFGESYSLHLTYERNIASSGLRLAGDLRVTERDRYVGLRMTRSFDAFMGKLSGYAQMDADYGLRGPRRHQTDTRYRVGLQANQPLANGALSGQLSIDRAEGATLYMLGGMVDTDKGSASVNATRSDQQPITRWTATTRTQVVLTPQGMTLGGQSGQTSGLTIKNQSKGSGKLLALIDGAQPVSVPPGARRFVALPAYRSYTVSLHPENGAALSGDETQKSVILYPGNVPALTARFTQITTAYGQIVDAFGNPMRAVSLKGQWTNSRIEADGRFQIDLSEADQSLEVIQDGKTVCLIRIQDLKVNEPVFNLGKVQCVNTALTASRTNRPR
ncbi:MAG: CS1-pili formation C-terminal domain-containing protein [Asticcacaulis sp.]